MIYVDELRTYPGSRRLWCHMATDGDLEELHQFAARIGLSRRWFQNHPKHPHYDLSATRRLLAIRAGAAAITSEEMVKKLS